jgi:uncharacterized protein (DUF1919 family)
MSPFISLYIHPVDYIKLLTNLDDYLNCKLEHIKHNESNHYKIYDVKEVSDQFIGKLNDVEIIFHHCTKTVDEVFNDWYRRKQILPKNKNEIIAKFGNEISHCYPDEPKKQKRYDNYDELIDKFYKLPYYKKVSFTSTKYSYPNNYVSRKIHSNFLTLGKNHRYYIRNILEF